MIQYAVQFKCYDEDGYEYSSRFAFVPKPNLRKKCQELMAESDQIVKVVAWDKETGKRLCVHPTKAGGLRPNAGRKTIDGIPRPYNHTITVNERTHQLFLRNKPISDFIQKLVDFYLKNSPE